MKKYFIFKPSDPFGNRAEELYFSLLKCRRENKRLILLKLKFDLFYKFKFRQGNFELLNIKHPLIVENSIIEFFNYSMTIFLAFLRIIGILINKLYYIIGIKKENIFLYASQCSINRDSIWKNRKYWDSELKIPLNISYGSRKDLESEFPILTGRKYICFHARTGGFWNDHEEAKFRNSTIEKYIPALQSLVDQNYLVIRLGDPSMPKIKLDGVIDYANSKNKSEKNDILLIEHCDFFIGTQSGPIDTACLFEKKILTINCTSMACNFWYRKGSMFIPRKAFYNNKSLSLMDQINGLFFEPKGTGLISENIWFQENSEEEILEAVKEFINFTDLEPIQKQFNSFLEDKLINYFGNIIKINNKCKLVEINRWISRIHDNQGSICKGYLLKNWDYPPIEKSK